MYTKVNNNSCKTFGAKSGGGLSQWLLLGRWNQLLQTSLTYSWVNSDWSKRRSLIQPENIQCLCVAVSCGIVCVCVQLYCLLVCLCHIVGCKCALVGDSLCFSCLSFYLFLSCTSHRSKEIIREWENADKGMFKLREKLLLVYRHGERERERER